MPTAAQEAYEQATLLPCPTCGQTAGQLCKIVKDDIPAERRERQQRHVGELTAKLHAARARRAQNVATSRVTRHAGAKQARRRAPANGGTTPPAWSLDTAGASTIQQAAAPIEVRIGYGTARTRVTLTEHAHETIRSLIKIPGEHGLETGGVLGGQWRIGETTITAAGGAGRNAKRTSRSYQSDGLSDMATVAAMGARVPGTIEHGGWHYEPVVSDGPPSRGDCEHAATLAGMIDPPGGYIELIFRPSGERYPPTRAFAWVCRRNDPTSTPGWTLERAELKVRS